MSQIVVCTCIICMFNKSLLLFLQSYAVRSFVWERAGVRVYKMCG